MDERRRAGRLASLKALLVIPIVVFAGLLCLAVALFGVHLEHSADIIPDEIDLSGLSHAYTAATPLILLYVAPLLIVAQVAKSRGRSMHYLWWPVVLSWLGALIAIVVILVQQEKPRQ